ncbi:hypothetical protein CIB95_09070 [Lottiidibacillus patelloidae]|uniref:Uncharacterized protein n=1 Tax=Lottiidibacillus patelloidae TaxID=2670334 RepID=A0A263BT54_9BACI|nr:hypothetical protein [Lottiidibacillus patelloidae]OZM56911.1 hypothetical protein CIB95_09070 [Lottiidibacillus patelloidae]
MKRKMEFINISEAVLNEDFIVISKVAMTDDSDFLAYEEGMDLSNVVDVTLTMFREGEVDHVIDVGQEIDIHLAVTLGFGVIKSLATGEMYLYQVNTTSDDPLGDEALRIAMYYQIMYPDSDDRKLDYILESNDGPFYLFLLLCGFDDYPIRRLREIFAAKKGKENNVIQLTTKSDR